MKSRFQTRVKYTSNHFSGEDFKEFKYVQNIDNHKGRSERVNEIAEILTEVNITTAVANYSFKSEINNLLMVVKLYVFIEFRTNLANKNLFILQSFQTQKYSSNTVSYTNRRLTSYFATLSFIIQLFN